MVMICDRFLHSIISEISSRNIFLLYPTKKNLPLKARLYPLLWPLVIRNSVSLANNYFASTFVAGLAATFFKGCQPCYKSNPHAFRTVIVIVVAALHSMAAISAFFANGKRNHLQKTQPLPTFCSPALRCRLRACHAFCAYGHPHECPKKPAKPLRKRTAVRSRKGTFLSAARQRYSQAVRFAAWVYGSANASPIHQAPQYSLRLCNKVTSPRYGRHIPHQAIIPNPGQAFPMANPARLGTYGHLRCKKKLLLFLVIG